MGNEQSLTQHSLKTKLCKNCGMNLLSQYDLQEYCCYKCNGIFCPNCIMNNDSHSSQELVVDCITNFESSQITQKSSSDEPSIINKTHKSSNRSFDGAKGEDSFSICQIENSEEEKIGRPVCEKQENQSKKEEVPYQEKGDEEDTDVEDMGEHMDAIFNNMYIRERSVAKRISSSQQVAEIDSFLERDLKAKVDEFQGMPSPRINFDFQSPVQVGSQEPHRLSVLNHENKNKTEEDEFDQIVSQPLSINLINEYFYMDDPSFKATKSKPGSDLTNKKSSGKSRKSSNFKNKKICGKCYFKKKEKRSNKGRSMIVKVVNNDSKYTISKPLIVRKALNDSNLIEGAEEIIHSPRKVREERNKRKSQSHHELSPEKKMPMVFEKLPPDDEIANFKKNKYKSFTNLCYCAKKTEISQPKQFEITKPKSTRHVYHVKVNPKKTLGFEGLPSSWKKHLRKINFAKKEILDFPEEVLAVLNYKCGTVRNLPSKIEANIQVRENALVITENPFNFYTIIKKIGVGAVGIVFAAKDNSSGKHVAIKQIPDTLLSDPLQMAYALTEISHLQMANHQNILDSFGTYRYNNSYWTVMEYMNGGSLLQFICNVPKSRIKEAVIAYILSQILHGIYYLHSQHRIHRDLKSDNILLNSNGQIKIGDFGYCCQLTREKNRRQSQVGTVWWMAPEVIRAKEYDSRCDIWSLGIIGFELAEGDPPHSELEEDNALFKIMSEPPPQLKKSDKWSKCFLDFMSRCLVKDQTKRAFAEELLGHPFVSLGETSKSKREYMKVFSKFTNKKSVAVKEFLQNQKQNY